MLLILAQETFDPGTAKDHTGNIIFIGVFFLMLLAALIWWLRR
ncbi:MAG: hypothetical protein ACFCVE_05545 [Phycisphaerae bacterium]